MSPLCYIYVVFDPPSILINHKDIVPCIRSVDCRYNVTRDSSQSQGYTYPKTCRRFKISDSKPYCYPYLSLPQPTMAPNTRSKTRGSSSTPTASVKTPITKKTTKKPTKKGTKRTSKSSTKKSQRTRKVAAPAREPFRNIPEGTCGTYQILDDDEIRAIGTTGCNTCLGLWVPINPTTCFVAHFNFEPLDNERQQKPTQRISNYKVGPACYRAVVMMTKEFLTREQWEGGWGRLTRDMREGLRMICPVSGRPGKAYTGDAIAEGVREFFGVREPVVIPDRYDHIIVRYARRPEGGVRPAPEVLYPNTQAVARDWRAINEEAKNNAAVAEFTDDGRARNGDDEWEGPHPPRAEDDVEEEPEAEPEEDTQEGQREEDE